MFKGLFFIFVFLLLGNIIQAFFEIIVPGPVIGLCLLLGALFLSGTTGRTSENSFARAIAQASERLFKYLPLFFVPAGVGVVAYWMVLKENLFSLVAILFLGALLTIIFTAFFMEKLFHLLGNSDDR